MGKKVMHNRLISLRGVHTCKTSLRNIISLYWSARIKQGEWMVMYINVRGFDCASVSVILGLGFGTVLTLWYFVFRFITAFDHWMLTITLKKTIPHVELNPLTFPDYIIKLPVFLSSLCCLTFVFCVGYCWCFPHF